MSQNPNLNTSTPAPMVKVLKPNIFIFIIIIFAFLVFMLDVLPDYYSYSEIYVMGGSYLEEFGRDPGFVYIVQTMGKIFDYKEFRILILLFFFIITIWILRLSQITYQQQFNLFHIFPFLLLIFFKFGIQIREGIALSLWLLSAVSKARGGNIIVFIILSLISISVHLSVAPYWLALYILRDNVWVWRFKKAFVFFVFSLFVFAIIVNASLLQASGEDSVFLSRFVEIEYSTIFQKFYWLIFAFIPVYEYFFEKVFRVLDIKSHWDLESFPLGFISLYGLLGVVFAVLMANLTGFFESTLKETVESIIRICSLLLMFYCMHMAFSYKRKIFTSILFLFLAIDTVRITMASLD